MTSTSNTNLEMRDEPLKEVPLHTEDAADDAHDLKGFPQQEAEQSIWQEVKENPRIIAFTALANAGSLCFGFDILVTGAVTALPAFS
jgi:MFS transporter, SP family, general alpha glucoside:H+ symporter